MTPAGIQQATFRFVAQQLNHCAGEYGETLKVPAYGSWDLNRRLRG